MGKALGNQTLSLEINPLSQKSFFPCLLVCDVLIMHSELLYNDQFTILSRNPFNKTETVK